jgi:Fe-S-cluster containining protein
VELFLAVTLNRMNPLHHRSYFFDSGIRFECQQCGACCTGSPGIVYVDKVDIERIARYLGMTGSGFMEGFLSPYRQSYTIREHADGRCLFYENGCRIYPVRPVQCRSFPFWFRNLRSEKNWRKIARSCPGIGEGPLFSRERILDIVQATF